MLFEGLIFGGAYIRRGLSTGGNLRFKIDWASLIVGSKFTIFALFCFVFDCNFPSTYIWRGDLTEGFLRYRIVGPIFGGAYTWRSIFSEFYGISKVLVHIRRTALIIGHLHDGVILLQLVPHEKITDSHFLDILGYLKNTHKNPKFERVRQVPIRELAWDLSHFAKFGILVGVL